MPQAIDFYFDFSSPYGYLAAERIDALAARHGREVFWRPMLLGAVFKQTGSQPLLDIPMKGAYARHDLARSARLIGVPFVIPPSFPFMSVAAARAYYWLADQDRPKAAALAKALYREAFGKGRDIDKAEAVVKVCVAEGLDGDAVAAALTDPAVKQRLREEVDAALAKQVFGSPYIVVDGESFWGHDRLAEVDLWLERAGW
ncbi:MAG: 2-hydroxychromene-2-carboxylate isomerase [Kiloniellales bacterium]|nr:2-hydroxychromene-2-carboxylate isomerase [Kiloniellales bacterium]